MPDEAYFCKWSPSAAACLQGFEGRSLCGTGEWHCSPECKGIATRMRERVSSVPVPLQGEYSWQVLRGKDGTHATTWALKAAQVPFRPHPSHYPVHPGMLPVTCKHMQSACQASGE